MSLRARDVTFLKLQPAVLCVECELISYNNTDHCLACGSQALLSLSRVLGGSLHQPARTVNDELVDRAVADIFTSSAIMEPAAVPAAAAARAAMQSVVEHAYRLTHADGAALAMTDAERMICTAQLGAVSPALGAKAPLDSGLSGLSIRIGRALRSDDTARDPRVDPNACRDLGVQSVVVAPLLHVDSVLGVLEVLSSQKYAFDDRQVATVESLAALMVLALVKQPEGQSLSLPQTFTPAQFASRRACRQFALT